MATSDTAASLRHIIQEALRAYELAAATRLRAEREASADHAQHLTLISDQQQQADQARANDLQRERETAEAEQARIGVLVQLADEAEAAAVELLEGAALAHVRGFGDASTGTVKPHTTTDEQAAAAFTAAQTAAVDLRAILLRLASAHLEHRHWDSARSILTPLVSAAEGALRDEATARLYASYLDEAVAAEASSDWPRARKLVDAALELVPADRRIDDALADHLVRITGQLVAAELAAGRLAGAASYLAAVGQKAGRDHPGLRQHAACSAILGWASDLGTCLQEFGGHSQPVQDVAFTADGEYVVSADGNQLKRWRLPGAGPGELVSTVPVKDTYRLAACGRLAASTDGKLLRAEDGVPVVTLAGEARGSIAALASTQDGAVVAWASRKGNPPQQMNLQGPHGLTPIGADGSPLAVARADTELMRPVSLGIGTARWILSEAVSTGDLQNRYYNGHQVSFRSANVRAVHSVHVVSPGSGEVLRVIPIEPSPLILPVGLSPTGEVVAWLHPEGKLVLTDVLMGITRHTFQLARSYTPYDTTVFSPGGNLVAAAQAYVTQPAKTNQWGHTVESPKCRSLITAWDINTGARICSWDIDGIVGAISFSPDERLIAALTTSGDIALYDVQGQEILTSPGEHGPATFPCLAFSPDGTRLVTSGDHVVKVWGLR